MCVQGVRCSEALTRVSQWSALSVIRAMNMLSTAYLYNMGANNVETMMHLRSNLCPCLCRSEQIEKMLLVKFHHITTHFIFTFHLAGFSNL